MGLAGSASERTEWLQAWGDLVALMVNQLWDTDQSADDEDVEGQPTQFDDWLFDRIGLVLLSLSEQSERRRLWQPVLDLGRPAHYWVERFLSHFLSRSDTGPGRGDRGSSPLGVRRSSMRSFHRDGMEQPTAHPVTRARCGSTSWGCQGGFCGKTRMPLW